MWAWLFSSIDPSRVHEVGQVVSWHGRSMVLAWAFLMPAAVLAARFLKVMPGQDWPKELDNPIWWRCHWMGQSLGLLLTIFGTGLILSVTLGPGEISWHGLLGYLVLVLLALQIALGIFRGSKGGPTAPARDGSLRGDHYDMTPWRRMFEWVHKSTGYALLMIGAMTVLFGLWHANAALWMWLVILLWWLALLCMGVLLQRRGWAIDTYEAIWGVDPSHPGTRLPARGWGMRRYSDQTKNG